MRNLSSYLNENKVTSKDVTKGTDKDFLKVAWKLSLDDLEKLLKDTESSYKNTGNIKGVLGTFDRRSKNIMKVRMKFIKDIINSKNENPDFIPEFVK